MFCGRQEQSKDQRPSSPSPAPAACGISNTSHEPAIVIFFRGLNISLTSQKIALKPELNFVAKAEGVLHFLHSIFHFFVVFPTSQFLFCPFSPVPINLQEICFKKSIDYVKGGKFLKKLWCCVGGSIIR